MNQFYFNRYIKFIENCKSKAPSGCIEKHHILPSSMGGTDEDSNKVMLTTRQHFIAHWMLWKAYENKEMNFAFWAMRMKATNGKRTFKIPSRVYAKLKEEHSSFQSKRMSESNPMYNEETREKLRLSKLGTSHSDETRSKMSKSRIGVKKSDETRSKMSQAGKGKPKSKEHRLALSKVDRSGNKNSMYGKRWYNDGKQNKIFIEGTQPSSWVLGKLKIQN